MLEYGNMYVYENFVANGKIVEHLLIFTKNFRVCD